MPINYPLFQKGYTLLEILVSMTISLFLYGVALFVYMALFQSQNEILTMNHLEEQLRSSMYKMVQHISRAGYSAAAINSVGTGINSNQFMAEDSDLIIPSSTCILFTYDSDVNGVLPALGSPNYDKRFGFRLANNVLQARPLTDSSFSCNAGEWQDLTDLNIIEVSNLSFVPNNVSVAVGNTSTLLIRNVSISITANIKGDPEISRTITQNVQVRNDKYQP